jgi:hypothetical protein
VACDAEGLQIGFPKDKTFNKRKAEGAERREALAAAFESVVGQVLKPTYVLLESESDEAAPSPETKDEDGVDEDAVLEKLKSEFDAEEVG